MLTDGLQRAADRGVRGRVLVDDGETIAGDEQILRLLGHPSVEVRIFNPFDYRGHSRLLRKLDFAFHARRLDYRMHNKLPVPHNALALISGRTIGNPAFHIHTSPRLPYDRGFISPP